MTRETAPSEPQPLPPGLAARRLTAADLDQALALSQEAGWNQNAADWRLFFDLGTAIGLGRTADGRLVATAATLPHGRSFAWISMVLVTAAERRRGLARWLLRACIAQLLAQGLTPALDATSAGRIVYRDFGFEDAWGLHRLVASDRGNPADASIPAGVTLHPSRAEDWPALIAYDAAVFGAERGALLRRLASRLPAAALIARRDGRLAGCLLGRDGRVMRQLGPLAAEDDGVARALLARAIATVPPPLAIDLLDRHAALGNWLGAAGFLAERPLTRMIYRRGVGFGDRGRLFAIAGPELG